LYAIFDSVPLICTTLFFFECLNLKFECSYWTSFTVLMAMFILTLFIQMVLNCVIGWNLCCFTIFWIFDRAISLLLCSYVTYNEAADKIFITFVWTRLVEYFSFVLNICTRLMIYKQKVLVRVILLFWTVWSMFW
jgi:hypothetical protein